MIIALTGRRNVGKSAAAGFLVEAGFRRCHPFEGGKVAAAAYFEHLGATSDEAKRMVNGDLKDVPSDLLPGGKAPRHFLEHFGKFLGVQMGVDYTLGAEIAVARRIAPDADLVIESLVYEENTVRAAGGMVVRITRPGNKGPAGLNTDDAQAKIVSDIEIVNDGSLDDLRRKVMLLAV